MILSFFSRSQFQSMLFFLFGAVCLQLSMIDLYAMQAARESDSSSAISFETQQNQGGGQVLPDASVGILDIHPSKWGLKQYAACAFVVVLIIGVIALPVLMVVWSPSSSSHFGSRQTITTQKFCKMSGITGEAALTQGIEKYNDTKCPQWADVPISFYGAENDLRLDFHPSRMICVDLRENFPICCEPKGDEISCCVIQGEEKICWSALFDMPLENAYKIKPDGSVATFNACSEATPYDSFDGKSEKKIDTCIRSYLHKNQHDFNAAVNRCIKPLVDQIKDKFVILRGREIDVYIVNGTDEKDNFFAGGRMDENCQLQIGVDNLFRGHTDSDYEFVIGHELAHLTQNYYRKGVTGYSRGCVKASKSIELCRDWIKKNILIHGIEAEADRMSLIAIYLNKPLARIFPGIIESHSYCLDKKFDCINYLDGEIKDAEYFISPTFFQKIKMFFDSDYKEKIEFNYRLRRTEINGALLTSNAHPYDKCRIKLILGFYESLQKIRSMALKWADEINSEQSPHKIFNAETFKAARNI